MITVLFSGGIDSWACLIWAISVFEKSQVQALYIDMGQVYADREYAAALQITARAGVSIQHIDMSGFVEEDEENAHIPLRNTFMLMQAAANENCKGVVFGMLSEETSEDKNTSYIKLMQNLLDSQFVKSIYRKETREFKIYTPFEKFTKTDVVAWSLRAVATEKIRNDIHLTIGCYKAKINEIPCGECASCINRWIALYSNNIEEEDYVRHPFYVLTSYVMDGLSGIPKNRQSIRQLWRKKWWLLDAFRAASKYSHTNFKVGLIKYIVKGGLL